MSELTVHNLSCSRGGRVIFCKVNFSVHRGQILILNGKNGSGKSTLLRALAGLIDPVAGYIQWSVNFSFLFLDHKDTLKSQLTLLENLNFWNAIYDTSALQVEAALEIFALGHLKDLPVQGLSLGQRQRLNLCRLLLCPAKIWLLDEPKRSLDQHANRILDMLFERHQKNGGTIVIASPEDSLPLQKDSLNLDNYQLYNKEDT
ncbi:MAG: heme ABC exporter ATP-binding protein CcmA [Alphaproteobacteria bacterium]|nr:heme ABC exporter ATP-binding protein CcmA [Alphaproteobacteria bacterium]